MAGNNRVRVKKHVFKVSKTAVLTAINFDLAVEKTHGHGTKCVRSWVRSDEADSTCDKSKSEETKITKEEKQQGYVVTLRC